MSRGLQGIDAHETIAVYGGSFDPPHVAHTLVVAYVLSAYDVDRVLVVPTAQHPFAKQLSSFEHRVHMVELAMRDLRRVEVCTIERELEGPSVTLRTLERLHATHPDADFRLVIGSDLIHELASWFQFERVEALAPPLVVPRAGHENGIEGPALPAISSTEVRKRLRQGEPTDGLLAPEVARYARVHRLYR